MVALTRTNEGRSLLFAATARARSNEQFDNNAGRIYSFLHDASYWLIRKKKTKKKKKKNMRKTKGRWREVFESSMASTRQAGERSKNAFELDYQLPWKCTFKVMTPVGRASSIDIHLFFEISFFIWVISCQVYRLLAYYVVGQFIMSVKIRWTIYSNRHSDDNWSWGEVQVSMYSGQVLPRFVGAVTYVHREFYWPKVSVRIKCKGGEER